MVAVGLTVMAAVVAPVFQLYPVPPLAVSVVLCPLQMDTAFGLITVVGGMKTFMLALAIAVQPFPSVTVTL